MLNKIGIIYDATGSVPFKPEGQYGKSWAGKDATIALAIMSLDPMDANRQDWDSLNSKDGNSLSPIEG